MPKATADDKYTRCARVRVAANQALKRDIEAGNISDMRGFAIVYQGRWHKTGDWFEMASSMMEDPNYTVEELERIQKFEKIFVSVWNQIPEDEKISALDCE